MSGFTIEEMEAHTYTPIEGQRGMYVMYELGACDRCGCVVQEANAINVGLGPLLAMRLTMRDALPPEMYYCETFGGAVCEDCWIGEEE